MRRGSLPALPVLADRDQLGEPVHLHRAVADERDRGAVGMGELGGDRVGHARSHRGERARQRRHHPRAELQVAGEPVGRRARVRAQDASSGSRCESSQNTRCGLIGSARSMRALAPSAPTTSSTCPRPVSRQERSVLRRRQRDQRPQRLLRVTDEVDLHRVADARHAAVDVDLDAARLTLFGQELRVGKARADHEQRVAVRSSAPSSASCRAGRSSRSRTGSRRARRLAEQRLGDAGAEQLRDLDHLVRRASAPAPTSIATRSPAFRTSAARAQSASAGTTRGARVAERRSGWCRGPRRLSAAGIRDVVGNDQAGDRPLGEGDPDSAVDRGGASARARWPSGRTRRRRP